MNSITQVALHEQSEQGRRTRHFRKASAARAQPEVVSRHAAVTLLAFRSYALRGDALTFLNDHCDELNGRPLDVAGGGDDGLRAVTALLAARTSNDGLVR